MRSEPPPSPPRPGRAALALRYLPLTGALVAAVGIAERYLAWPLLTSTIGPTAYVFAARPRSDVFVLELAGSHHAPSAATARLITTGLAKPGAQLIGLVLGLAFVIALGPPTGRIPLARSASMEDPFRQRESPRNTGTVLS